MPLKYFAVILQINLFSQGEAPRLDDCFMIGIRTKTSFPPQQYFILPSITKAQYILFTDYYRHIMSSRSE